MRSSSCGSRGSCACGCNGVDAQATLRAAAVIAQRSLAIRCSTLLGAAKCVKQQCAAEKGSLLSAHDSGSDTSVQLSNKNPYRATAGERSSPVGRWDLIARRVRHCCHPSKQRTFAADVVGKKAVAAVEHVNGIGFWDKVGEATAAESRNVPIARLAPWSRIDARSYRSSTCCTCPVERNVTPGRLKHRVEAARNVVGSVGQRLRGFVDVRHHASRPMLALSSGECQVELIEERLLLQEGQQLTRQPEAGRAAVEVIRRKRSEGVAIM